MSEIQSLTERALADVAAAQTPAQLEALRVALLGKSGSITAQLKQLGRCRQSNARRLARRSICRATR